MGTLLSLGSWGISFLYICCHALIENILLMTRMFRSRSGSWSDGSFSDHVLCLYPQEVVLMFFWEGWDGTTTFK